MSCGSFMTGERRSGEGNRTSRSGNVGTKSERLLRTLEVMSVPFSTAILDYIFQIGRGFQPRTPCFTSLRTVILARNEKYLTT